MAFIVELLKEFSAVVAGGGVGILTVTLLSKKIIDLRISKDIEKFKSSLALDQKINSERELFVLNSQIEVIKELWELILNLLKECENFDGDITKLEKVVIILESSYDKSRPFIGEEIELIISKLLVLSNPEKYDGKSFNKMVILKNELIVEYRKVFIIS